MEEALAGQTQTLGSEHPSTINSASNLGTLLRKTGEYRAAVPLLEVGLAADQRALGDDHASTLHSGVVVSWVKLQAVRAEERSTAMEQSPRQWQHELCDSHTDCNVTGTAVAGFSTHESTIEMTADFEVDSEAGSKEHMVARVHSAQSPRGESANVRSSDMD